MDTGTIEEPKKDTEERSKFIKEHYDWQDFIDVVHCLRQPDGCPWDSTQTYESMRKCVLDEAQEVVDAVDHKDFINLREELGDLLLQVLLYSEIAAEREEFTLADVIDEAAKKMVRRHPHVFPTKEALGDTEKALGWKEIKYLEKVNRFKEYEEMYQAGKVSRELVKMQEEKINKISEDFPTKPAKNS